jgi:excisionase family DNA binding protein
MPSRRVKVPAKIEKKLISRDETAQVLGNIHIRTVDEMVKSGQLKAVKLGRRNMITAKSVEELVAAK